jgi:hypothetical protein
VHRKKRKKDDDEHQLLVVFSRCTKTKEKKTMTSANLLSFSLGVQKQNKKR